MKAKTSISAAIITLVAMILGFFMPGVICGIQDNRREAQVMNHESGSVQLVFADAVSLADKLLLIKNGYSRVDLNTGKNLDMSGAQQAAMTVLNWIQENGFYPGSAFEAADFSCVPFLATSTDDTKFSAIFWQCDLQDNYGNQVKMLIDDENGKMISYFYGEASEIDAKTVTTYAYKKGGIGEFANMCMVYYGFSKWDISSINSNGDSDEFTFLFADENGTNYELLYVITKNSYGFNV